MLARPSHADRPGRPHPNQEAPAASCEPLVARKRRLVLLIAVNLGVPLVVLAAAELVARQFYMSPVPALFDDPELYTRNRDFATAHSTRGFALRPDFAGEVYTTNKDGFRGAPLPPDPEAHWRIAALGESTTFGWRVSDTQTYPYVLGQELNRRGPRIPVLALNAGVPSYTSAQTRLYLEELLTTFRPQVVLLNVLWNDVLLSLVRPWYPELLVRQEPAAWRSLLTRHSALYRALSARKEIDPSERVDPSALNAYLGNLEAMIDMCERAGVEVVLVEPPFASGRMSTRRFNPFQVSLARDEFVALAGRYLDAMRELAKSRGVPVVDHHLSAKYIKGQELFVDFLHPSAKGNHLIAQTVASYLWDKGLVPRAQAITGPEAGEGPAGESDR